MGVLMGFGCAAVLTASKQKDELIRQCGWCRKILSDVPITTGVCPSCSEKIKQGKWEDQQTEGL